MYTDVTPAIATAEDVLAGAAGVREQTRLLERGLVVLAVEWAKHNPGHPYPGDHPGYEGMEDQWVFDQLHAQGCLAFDDSTVSEFAIAAGLTEYSGRKFIRESLMLVHFLPHVWARVLAGGLEVWRARQLAGDCFGLPPQAVAFIDRHMADRTAKITVNSRERIVTEARKQFLPEQEAAAEQAARSSRKIEVLTHEAERGVAALFGLLDLPDALALDTALTIGAEALKSAGSDAPLDTRRAWALGDLARLATGDAAPAPHSGPTPECSPDVPFGPLDRPHWDGSGIPAPQTTLFIHLPAGTITQQNSPGSIAARVQGPGIAGDAMCDPDSIREWFTRDRAFTNAAPVINVRPVLDLDQPKSTGGYVPPPRTKEHTRLTHDTCVFPFCTRQVLRCDIDHIEPWKPRGAGGATCTCNLAPLCRTHHRLKTHADNASTRNGRHNEWSYVHLGGQEYYWHGPRGMEFISNSLGTYNASLTRDDGAPNHPGLPASASTPIDLGDDDQRQATEELIDTLLSKASATRGVHNRNYAPLWEAPLHPASDDPPDDYPDDEQMGGTLMFLVPYPGNVEWPAAA